MLESGLHALARGIVETEVTRLVAPVRNNVCNRNGDVTGLILVEFEVRGDLESQRHGSGLIVEVNRA